MLSKEKIAIRPKETNPWDVINRQTKVIVALIILFVATIGMNIFFNKKIADDTYKTYINNTREIINSQKEIETSNNWERMPINQRKEQLRNRYYEIFKYYTTNIPVNQKMSDDQLLKSFDVFYNCIISLNSVNFFLPISYMKAKTNFNPNFSNGYQYGIAGLYISEAQKVSYLPLMKEIPSFQIAYNGRETLQNPIESLKFIIARMDYLLKIFNNREDWIIFSLVTDENSVIEKYWSDGKGEIPEKFYKDGLLKDTLDYYYAFKNWKIPATAATTK